MNKYLKLALLEARKAYLKGECPIGAVLVKDDKVISRAHNLRELKEDPLGHAEILAIKKASRKLKTWRLEDTTLYVTLEPCAMCAGAIVNSRIKEVYFGALDLRNGAVISNCDTFNLFTHKVKATYLAEDECSKIITNFFRDLRYNIDLSETTIETKRLLLRSFKLTDINDYFNYANNKNLEINSGFISPTTILEAEEEVKSFMAERSVLALTLNDVVIGHINLLKKYYPAFGGLRYRELSYVLSEEYQHQGLMQEALSSLITYLFKTIKLDIICVSVNKLNQRSLNTILNLKFRQYHTKGKTLFYYLAKEDWQDFKILC